MCRWLTIFLLILLPAQLTWAAAAGYCQHETDKQVSHFGHHEHKHQGAKLKAGGTEPSDAAGNLGALDDDCAVCHLGCVAPVASSLVVDVVVPVQAHDQPAVAGFESHVPEVPQRPDRSLAV